jgi:hypothetical protein
MRRSRGIAGVLGLLLVLGLLRLDAPGTGWAEALTADWQPTGLAEPVRQLYTPASGAFFARTASGLQRSNDGGATWIEVGLPPPAPNQSSPELVVDPIDHTTIYAGGFDGLYKTTDDAATWSVVLSTASLAETNRVLAVAVSPADRQLVYAGFSGPSISSDFRFMRSQDGGQSWQQLEEHHNTLCGWGISILQPHPTDPTRLYRAAGCHAGRSFNEQLWLSPDQGATWAPTFEAPSGPGNLSDPRNAYPDLLVGGRGAQPARFYLAAHRDPRLLGGGSLFRSDDEGTTWNEVLAFRIGQTLAEPTAPLACTPGLGCDQQAPTVRLDGLTYDPSAPEHLFVGLNEYNSSGYQRARNISQVLASADGGSTWAALGPTDPGEIHDLALGIDGTNLYAATDRGVWRLALR